ncbi:MAG: hypothetical protein ACLTSZ_18990 [Lachnospiraceae bacterium]
MILGPPYLLVMIGLYTLSLASSMLKSPMNPNWAMLLTLGVAMVIPVFISFFVARQYSHAGPFDVWYQGLRGHPRRFSKAMLADTRSAEWAAVYHTMDFWIPCIYALSNCGISVLFSLQLQRN